MRVLSGMRTEGGTLTSQIFRAEGGTLTSQIFRAEGGTLTSQIFRAEGGTLTSQIFRSFDLFSTEQKEVLSLRRSFNRAEGHFADLSIFSQIFRSFFNRAEGGPVRSQEKKASQDTVETEKSRLKRRRRR